MSGLETAIRNALEKSDRSSAEVRARIYQSARQALENGLRKQGVEDPQAVALQRQRLEAIIDVIERDEREKSYIAEPPDISVAPDDHRGQTARAGSGNITPDVDIRPTRERAPVSSDAHAPDQAGLSGLHAERSAQPAARERKRKSGGKAAVALPVERKRRRGFFSRLFIYSIFLVFLGMGVWWIQASGLLLSPRERDTSVPNPPATVVEEDFNGSAPEGTFDPTRGFSDDWVEIFNAARDSGKAAAGEGVTASQVATSTGAALRVTSTSEAGRISLPVAADMLREMAGKSSTVAVTLRSSSDKPVQISISCDFASLGKCSRHRFTATPEKADALFRVSFDRSLAPNTPGNLLVDVDGANGAPVDIYAVRLLPGQ